MGWGHSETQTLPSLPEEGSAWPKMPPALPGLLTQTHPNTAWHVGVGEGVGLLCSTGARNILRNIISCHMGIWEVSETQHNEGAIPIS